MVKCAKEKIGILGGTFDPIHRGHLKYAEKAKELFGFDTVFFIPSGNPPHKVTHLVTSAAHRLEMAKIAVKGHNGFEVKTYETDRTGESFTADTLREIKRDYPDAELYYMIGTDILPNLLKWKESDEIFRLASFVWADRGGADEKEIKILTDELENAGCRLYRMALDPIEISSTDIRKMIKNGENLSEYLTPEVCGYIAENGLYKNTEFPLSDEDIQADLKNFLKKERYEHSLGVMEEAVRIGKIVGADLAKCKTAGLLHDCGKNLSKEQLKWLGFDREADKEELYNGYNKRLLHAKTGVVIARERYGIEDEEILEAIRNHITGKPEMSLLSCIVFLADFTEKGREGAIYDEARRKIEKEGLYSAMLYECETTMGFVISKGERLDVNTLRTRNWLITELETMKNAK